MDEWIDSTLGNEFEIVMGQSPPSEYYNKSGKGLPFFQGKKEFSALYPQVEIWCAKATKKAEQGDVLLSVRAPIGPVNVAPEKCGIGRGLAAIKPNINTSTKFIFYLMQSKEPQLQKKGTGTTFSAITKPNLFSIPIRIPASKEEREAIVSELEKQFTRLDESVKSLKKVKQKLGIYRKSVLKAAFDGRLIKTKGNWIKTTLGGEFVILMGQSPSSEHYNSHGEGVPFFQGKKEFTQLYPIKEIWSRNASKTAEKDDVLLSVRAPIGPVNLAPEHCGIGRGLAAIKPNEKTNSKLIFYLMKLKSGELEQKGTGTTFRAITKPNLFSVKIELPDLKEDRDLILQEIESRFSVIEKLEKTVDGALQKSEMLRKSILKSAFEGKLVS